MGQYVGFRLGKKDADIEKALGNAKDITKEVKRLLRLGIAVSNGKLSMGEPPIDWNESFKDKEPLPESSSDIASNILGGFDD